MLTFYDAKLIQSIYFEDRWLKYPTDSVFLFVCFTCLFWLHRIKRQPIFNTMAFTQNKLPISHYQILGGFFSLDSNRLPYDCLYKIDFFPSKRVLCIFKIFQWLLNVHAFPKAKQKRPNPSQNIAAFN